MWFRKSCCLRPLESSRVISQIKSPESRSTNQVCAILLAAGQSQRMGAFKPLLPFGDSSVIKSCVRYLQRAGIESIVVVVGHHREEVQRQFADQPLLFAVNNDPKSEMATSIRLGVEMVPSSAAAAIVALTDQPAIPAFVVTELIDHWRSGAKIVKPEFGDCGGHPVLIDLAYRTELLQLPEKGGLKTFMDAHAADLCRIHVDTPFIARDMDTWDDYLALHQEVFGFLPPDNRTGGPTKSSQGSSKGLSR